jgi:simple sugar transport system permease protein
MIPSRRLVDGVTALAAVLLCFNVTVWLAGESPADILWLLAVGTVGSAYGLAQCLAKATPLVWTGAAVAFALHARLFNIGVEGQCAVGILVAAVLGAALPVATPWVLAVPLCLAAAACAGAALGGLAGWLRARWGTHEVVSTLMLNGLVAVLTTWLYAGPLRVGAQVHTRPVVAGARLPQAARVFEAFRGSSLNAALPLALAATVLAGWYLRERRGGVAIRALGAGAQAAEALGVGALAGLAASHYVLGVKGSAEQGLGAGVGFTGIAVALLGGGRPLGIALAAGFFGAMAQGALVVNARVPADVLTLTQAAVIVAVGALGASTLPRREAP